MVCPACSRPIPEQQLPDGSIDLTCPACGWGKGRPASKLTDQPAAPDIGRVALFWVLAILVFFGPYIALRIGIPVLMDNGTEAFADASDRLIGLLNIHYWWIMAVYVFLCAVFSPTYDRDNVGWFGGFVDNPFSWQDDWERQKRAWAFFLFPGKAVAAAFISTWKLVTAK